MRILVMADMDSVPAIPDGSGIDLMIGCGDIHEEVLLETAEASGCRRILAVKGNHDSNASFRGPIESLHLKIRSYLGVSFGGLNGCWRYKPRGNFLYEQEEVEELLACFPAVDVFVGHNSPAGVHERGDMVHVGFTGVLAYIKRARPGLMLHGHQHSNSETGVSATRVVGVFGFRMVEYP